MKRSLLILLAFLPGLLVTVPAAAQQFGSEVAVSGGEILFAAPVSDQAPGAVFVYRSEGGTWTEAARLTADDGMPGDRFGSSIAVDEGRLIVGAFWADSGAGAAYVFEKGQAGTWTQTAKLDPATLARGDSLGVAVALDGDLALVAARVAGDSTPGAVFAFRRDPASGEWSPAGSLTGEGIGPNGRFGAQLALSGDVALIAAMGHDSVPRAVFMYQAEGDEWNRVTMLSGPDESLGYGAAMEVAGDRLLISDPAFAGGVGAVYVYEPETESGEWEPVARLLPFAGGERLFFGSSIALAGDEIWIGAPAADRGRGSVYRFHRGESDEWALSSKLGIDDLARGDAFAATIAVGDGIAAAGLPGDDYGAGTGAIFVEEGGEWRFSTRVASEIEPLPTVTGDAVACAGGSAAGFECEDVTLVSFLPVQSIGGERGVQLNDIWGWTDPETGNEYALVGRVDGTSFVDITDPVNPVYVGNLPRTEGSPGSTWRDIKVYENHAFIVADNAGEHGMQVFDLTRLRDVQNAPATFDPDTTYHRIHSAHNIVINTESGFAYTVGNGGGGETCGGGLHMIDIRDPLNPRFAGCFSDPSTGRQGTGYTHDAQCVTYHGPDEDYQGREICFGSNETALSIADVTDKDAPVAIAMAEYPNVGYTHQAWLTEDHRYLLMDDELDEMQGLVEHTRTLIWDVADLDDPILIHEYFNPTTISIDHNLYVKGDKVYQSNYVAGLRILDISDIENPEQVGYFDTVPYGSDGPRFDGSWSNYPFFESGVIVVTSGSEGLFLLRYDESSDRPVS